MIRSLPGEETAADKGNYFGTIARMRSLFLFLVPLLFVTWIPPAFAEEPVVSQEEKVVKPEEPEAEDAVGRHIYWDKGINLTSPRDKVQCPSPLAPSPPARLAVTGSQVWHNAPLREIAPSGGLRSSLTVLWRIWVSLPATSRAINATS